MIWNVWARRAHLSLNPRGPSCQVVISLSSHTCTQETRTGHSCHVVFDDRTPECPSVRPQKGVLWTLPAAVKGMTKAYMSQHEEVSQACSRGEYTQWEKVPAHVNLHERDYHHLRVHTVSARVYSRAGTHPELRREVASEEDPVGSQDGLNFPYLIFSLI